MEFAELAAMQNEITHYTAGFLPTDFAWVGVAERFGESMRLLRRTIGLEKSVTFFRDNVNPDRTTESYELSDADFCRIAELNSSDMDWYAAAVKNFQSENDKLTADPVKLRAEVSRFVEQLAI
jgi:hypothetical protein